MNTYELCDKLSAELTEDQLLIVGSSCMAIRIFKKHYTGKARMMESNKAQGAMGAALPMAIACAFAGASVVLVDGEGSFSQSLPELEVVRRHTLDITIIVIVNGGYASIHNSEKRWCGRISEGATFPLMGFIKWAFRVEENMVIVLVPHDEVPPPKEV